MQFKSQRLLEALMRADQYNAQREATRQKERATIYEGAQAPRYTSPTHATQKNKWGWV